jgi:hypothetical protein
MKRSQLLRLWITNNCETSSRNSTNRDCSAGRSWRVLIPVDLPYCARVDGKAEAM